MKTQELIIGRTKESGAPLDGVEGDGPAALRSGSRRGAHPADARTSAWPNPRTGTTEKNRILRRGYNYSNGFTPDGQLDQGLLFVCFQRSLDDGFVAVQTRLNGETLEEYIRPVGGGFFFVPPGRSTTGEMFAAALFA